jgi:hypothetical protein
MSETVVVRVPVAPLNAEPTLASERVSQVLAGHGLGVLESRGPWLRARTADAYEGWLHSGYTAPVSPPMARERTGAVGAVHAPDLAAVFGTTTMRRDGRRISLGCTVRERDGRRRTLPLGALVEDDREVERGVALAPAEMAERFPGTPSAIARTAVELFEGTAYEWGGITPWGADCSGLVQMTFGLHGIPLPRDTGPQSRSGTDAGAALDALRAADLLFFSERPDGRVTHVGIALGAMRMVHLALGRGGYAVEQLDDLADPYVANLVRWFRVARRVV